MSDDVTESTTMPASRGSDFPRRFTLSALLLSAVAVASMAIALMVPTGPAGNYFGRSPAELVGPEQVPGFQYPSTDCSSTSVVRLTKYEFLQTVRVCPGSGSTRDKPITVVRSGLTAAALDQVAVELAKRDRPINSAIVCVDMGQERLIGAQTGPEELNVKIGGDWYFVQYPTNACGTYAAALAKAVNAVRTLAVNAKAGG